MPTLKPYTAQLVTPETGFQRATPESFGSEIGAGLQNVGHGANVLYSNIEERESRDANVGTAQVRAKYAKLLDAAQLSGEDTGKLKQDMEEELAKVGENFRTARGQRALDMHTANTNLMFDEQANRIEVTRASAEAQLQAKQQIDSDSATLRSNPSFLSFAEDNARALVSTFRLPPEKRALVENQMIEQLNMAAVASGVRIDPEGMIEKLESGKFTLTPEQRQQGIQMAQQQITARRVEEEYAHRLIERDRIERGATAQDILGTKILKGTLKSGEIADNPDLSWQQKAELTHFQAWLMNDSVARSNKPHPGEMMRLWRIYHDPSNPNYTTGIDPLLESARRSALNASEADTVAGWAANQKDENNRTLGSRMAFMVSKFGAAWRQDPRYMWPPQLAAEIELEYQDRVFKKVGDLRATGEKNLARIFDAKDKDYVGSIEYTDSVAREVKQRNQSAGTATEAPTAGAVVVRDGVSWRFKGGKPGDPGAWERVQ